MQALLDIYRLSESLKLDTLMKTSENLINNYYGRIYPQR